MRQLDSVEALHIQVARHFRGLIREGRLIPGQRLRPLRQIAHELGASINPIQTAFRTLEREGLVNRRHGIGVFVGEAQVRLPATLEIGVLFRSVPAWSEHDNYLLLYEENCDEQEYVGYILPGIHVDRTPSSNSDYSNPRRSIVAGIGCGKRKGQARVMLEQSQSVRNCPDQLFR